MAFYIRKSVRVGPFRFNLSKSGIGVSGGITGLRIGAGPRGNYVHMGRRGLYYRRTLPSGRRTKNETLNDAPIDFNQELSPAIDQSALKLREIESASVSEMVDVSSQTLLDELNEKRRSKRRSPLVVLLLSLFLLYGIVGGWSGSVLAGALAVSVLIVIAARRRDVARANVVLFYDLDEEILSNYRDFFEEALQILKAGKLWHIAASGEVDDKRYHAGADSLVNRSATYIRQEEPPHLKTNIGVIAVGVGRQTLYFLPDRILVYDVDGVGAVAYSELQLAIQETKFVEEGEVPPDTEIVGSTWRYVNKSGNPDRRFKDNWELPICLYESVSLRSRSGLNELLQFSRVGAGREFVQTIKMLSLKSPANGSH